MKFKTLVAALAVAGIAPAFAGISPGISTSGTNAAFNGIGELFLVVFDSDAKVSYTLDMGVTQNNFFVAGQSDAGFTQSWSVGADANFTSLLGQTNLANLQWSVLATDQTGGTAVGGVRLFTTLKNGSEAEVPTLSNQLFSVALGSSQAGTFFNAINTTGTHGIAGQAIVYANNGSSVNKDSDSGNSYFGDGSVGLSTNLNGNATFSNANKVGEASAFYYVARSSTNQIDTVSVDPFNNLGGNGSFVFANGANGYELNYTLAPVPEPESIALLLAGLGVVGMMIRRRRAD